MGLNLIKIIQGADLKIAEYKLSKSDRSLLDDLDHWKKTKCNACLVIGLMKVMDKVSEARFSVFLEITDDDSTSLITGLDHYHLLFL